MLIDFYSEIRPDAKVLEVITNRKILDYSVAQDRAFDKDNRLIRIREEKGTKDGDLRLVQD